MRKSAGLPDRGIYRRMRAFMEDFRKFGTEDEYLLCEVARADATRAFLEKERPDLLSAADDPSKKEEIYRAMKQASEIFRNYLIRPFPGDVDFFYEFFLIYLSFPSILEFLEFLSRAGFLSSFYLPEEVLEQALAEGDSMKIFEPEFFVLALMALEDRLREKELHLLLSGVNPGMEAFLRYVFHLNPNIKFLERVEASGLRPGDYAILPAIPRRGRLRMRVSATRSLIMLKKAPEGVRFFIIVSRNFLNSMEMEGLKEYLASQKVEKINFMENIGLASILLTKKGEKEYLVEIHGQGKVEKIPSLYLKSIPIWSSEFLLSKEREPILNFFIRTEKVPLEEVAEVRRGYFLRKSGEKGRQAEVKILSVGDIEEGEIDTEKLKKVKIELRENFKPLKSGDLVISARGTLLKLGIVPQTREIIYPADSVIVVSPKKYPSHLLYLFFKSPVGRLLLSSARKSGLLLSMAPSDVRKIPVPELPPHLLETLGKKVEEAHKNYREKILKAEQEYRKAIEEVERVLFFGENG